MSSYLDEQFGVISIAKRVSILAQEVKCYVKGALSGLTKILAAESYLKMMKNAFYFTLKVLFVLRIFTFLY